MSLRLTKNEWGQIKQLLTAGQFTRKKIAYMRHRSPTVVRQVEQTHSFVEYRKRHDKRFKPNFWERLQLWLQ